MKVIGPFPIDVTEKWLKGWVEEYEVSHPGPTTWTPEHRPYTIQFRATPMRSELLEVTVTCMNQADEAHMWDMLRELKRLGRLANVDIPGDDDNAGDVAQKETAPPTISDLLAARKPNRRGPKPLAATVFIETKYCESETEADIVRKYRREIWELRSHDPRRAIELHQVEEVVHRTIHNMLKRRREAERQKAG